MPVFPEKPVFPRLFRYFFFIRPACASILCILFRVLMYTLLSVVSYFVYFLYFLFFSALQGLSARKADILIRSQKSSYVTLFAS